MWTYVAIAIGGTLGCWARYAQSVYVQATLFILTLERLMIPPSVRVGVLTGVLGGYTTFSTFEMETLLLAESGEFFKAGLYVVLSVVIGFAAAFGGAYLARNL
jgi:fluoride exporter